MSPGLALGLTLRAGRSAVVRLALMAFGVALGVLMLLAVGGALPAAQARQDVASSRASQPPPADGTPVTEGVAAQGRPGFWRGREVHSLRFRVVGKAVAPPPGVDRLPAAGEVLASPALQVALRGPHGDELAARVPGRIVGTVTPDGLVGPDELYFVAPADDPADSVADVPLGAGFASPGTAVGRYGDDDTLRIAAPLAAVALVVPLLALIRTSTRLSAATRERRTAAMRLVGATSGQLARLAAVEGVLVGVTGTVVGVGLFALLRGPVARLVPVTDGVFGATVSPSPLVAGLVVLGVPLLAAVTAPLALRHVLVSPLATSRRARAPRAGFVRLVPLVVGMAMLLAAYADRRALQAGDELVAAMLVGGAAVVLLGIVVAGAALARLAGLLLHRLGPGPASQLAGQRLVMDPGAAARTVTGAALVVAVLGWLLAFVPLLAQARSGWAVQGQQQVRDGTVTAALTSPQDAVGVQALQRLSGVSRAVVVHQLVLRPPAGARLTVEGTTTPAPQVTAVVADCAGVSAMLRRPLPGCRAGQVQLVQIDYGPGGSPTPTQAMPPGRFGVLSSADDGRVVGHVDVPASLSTLTIPADVIGALNGVQVDGQLIVPPELATRFTSYATATGLLVGTDGRAATVEAVRGALTQVATSPYAPPLTLAERVQVARGDTDGYRQAALVGALAVVLVGGLSLAVSTADGLRERRRAHAALVAIGVPLKVLRRSVLLQVAAPLLLSVLLALGVAASASALYLRLAAVGEPAGPLPLPWSGYGLTALVAVVVSVLATVMSLPFVRAAGRPEALRTE